MTDRPIDHLPKPAHWQYTVREAHDRFACAKCGTPVHPASRPPDGDHVARWDQQTRDEYWLSGMCRKCQVAFFVETPSAP